MSKKAASPAPLHDVVIPYEELKFGFRYGAATVERCCSDEKKGWVVIEMETPKQKIQLYVTKTGKIRINDSEGEWFRMSKD